jgi:IclR helix-turn-helix domain
VIEQYLTPEPNIEPASDTTQRISIELDDAQINRVINAASNAGHLSTRLANLGSSSRAPNSGRPQVDDRRLSRSLLVGLRAYATFPLDGTDLGINELSQQLAISASTCHRYISTLVAAGLLERDTQTRRYRLTRTTSR